MPCSAVVPVEASCQPEKRVDSPRTFCNSPSSISDVDFSRSSTDKAIPVIDKIDNSKTESGDELKAQDGMRTLPSASGPLDINKALAHPVSSSQSLKRKAEQETEKEQHQVTKKIKTQEKQLTPAEVDSDYLPTDISEDEECPYEHPESSVSRDGYADNGCAPGYDSAADVECSSESTRRSRRTLYIEYWSRTDECKERKWDHLDEIAENYGSAEEHIFATTLKGRTAFLEPNMFPYDTPAGIEHWTLWHVKDLNHEQVKKYVENWIDANAPHVARWNYDDNPERSIDIFHVHVYFQVAEGLTVLQDRKVEDLVHELD
ncbi:uncharacterized protein PITG_02537 [Phytophthora infestans T30-4]|uniref:Uncharacterized protein n=1 Tax=Phytophthora infestans (strain T30-4) TaxID=403677 RepID=D0MWK7_PHYIT|nr:uncharacterized protein PITG_02537 [Phytophthora infestans T30-4]EEY64020.1 conserved hypothetical protein [Phytophthora infestans T30-4]KAI9986583.1 hypothetical protein PInf_025536 [Phytophthora infestans]KAI9986658.1 hypothetical protein PInf_025613 [Phytophthora infestans]|eukprot:XP_002907456.1 conserved hypothetical protein [Phytophthora infestans T30-4]